MESPLVSKSSRHSKITGDFAESLVLYFLSKHGFECAKVDHTGIDLIARNPHTKEVMGISVKSRSRNPGTEGTYISLPNDNFTKVDAACVAFNCSPYFAVVVDEENSIKVFLITKKRLLEIFPMQEKMSAWKMTKSWLEKYENDKEIMYFDFNYKFKQWWGGEVI